MFSRMAKAKKIHNSKFLQVYWLTGTQLHCWSEYNLCSYFRERRGMTHRGIRVAPWHPTFHRQGAQHYARAHTHD